MSWGAVFKSVGNAVAPPPPPQGLPTWLANEPTAKWVAAPNSTPSSAPGLVPTDGDNLGAVRNLVNAWNGAITDGSRFIIHGGGHGDYAGNEIGAINLTQNSPSWSLLIERSPLEHVYEISNYYGDGRPTSRHTYYGMWYVPQINKMVRFNAHMGDSYEGPFFSGGGDGNLTNPMHDVFDLNTNTWQTALYGPALKITAQETSMACDESTGDCYAISVTNILYKWARATNTTTEAASLGGSSGGGAAMVFDVENQRLVRFAGRIAATVSYVDMGTLTKVTPTLTGPDAGDLTSLIGNNHGWGVAHDTTRNVAYLLRPDDCMLWRIRLDDFHVQRVAATGVTPTLPINRIWGRLKYISDIDSIAYLAHWDTPVLVMRAY